ncbi:MAG TPA: hypothetical protein VGZ32_22150 [Actinocrinis sp.]|jgi:hypothetical protein|uniref:hypothetical protein n=1 Tax=Actinocrinis sp. TaxID=1920516 RepID=UPI002DDD0BD0|nr:hypothetical protein [Actinocrinis sp.]HEV3173065.1 hypothetical protein [Actinocrinis sp.]
MATASRKAGLTLELSPNLAAACRWVASLPSRTAFDLADLLDGAPNLSSVQAQALLAALEEADLLRRHHDPVIPSRPAAGQERRRERMAEPA